MILFAILAITLILSIIFITLVAGTAGAVGVVVFGDVIVCGAIIIWIMKWLMNRDKKK